MGEGTDGGPRCGIRCGRSADARQLVDATLASPWNAMLSEESFEVLVFLEEGVFCASDGREVLLQSKNFLLESFDVELLTLTMGSEDVVSDLHT